MIKFRTFNLDDYGTDKKLDEFLTTLKRGQIISVTESASDAKGECSTHYVTIIYEAE